MISAAAFTLGATVPSTRFRVSQYVGPLSTMGVDITQYHARVSSYPPPQLARRPGWMLGELASRIVDVARARKHDVTILQREFVSTIPTLERLTKPPRILDVDDAIWLRRRGRAANTIAKSVDHIVCGNDYLASYFGRFGHPVTVIPTAIDTARFTPTDDDTPANLIGWSGSSSGYRYLHRIEGALAEVLERNPDWRLRIVSDKPPKLESIPAHRVEFRRWSLDSEVADICQIDIGLMPLDASPWSLGKCSYKMLLHMACGRPVVASDVGMNHQVLAMGSVGLGAVRDTDWVRHLDELIRDASLRTELGRGGRRVVEDAFAVDVLASRWREVIREVTAG